MTDEVFNLARDSGSAKEFIMINLGFFARESSSHDVYSGFFWEKCFFSGRSRNDWKNEEQMLIGFSLI